jgi:DnaJ-class molecular chaperone
MARNFYVVLGVSRDADPSQIREAHRRLVRIHHPDTGTGSAERFTEVQQAYETLSDESQRRLYDETLPGRPKRGRPLADPLVSSPMHTQRRVPVGREVPTRSPFQNMADGLWSAVDEFFEGFVPGFFTSGRTASRRKDLYVEIVLEPDEAARGGLFPLQIPIREPCENCVGRGYVGLFSCPSCHGNGAAKGQREVEISMPAGVTDGTTARLSLEDIGLNGVDLNVLVSVR